MPGRNIERVTGRQQAGRKQTPPFEPGSSVAAAVTRDLAALARRAPELAAGGLAVAALALAAEIDEPGNSATSKSMCARAMYDALEKLAAMAPPEQEADRIDDLSARRSKRLAS